MRLRNAVIGLALSSAACGGVVKRPDGGSGLLPVGANAPEVVATDLAQHEVRLTTLRGKNVVVYFYPKDDTPGCTKEACAFRDAWKKYEAANVTVIGVSTGSIESHREFQTKYKLPFPLAADTEGTVGVSYGVPKKLWGYDRVTFLVDREGKVKKIWPAVDPGVHADEVLRAAAD